MCRYAFKTYKVHFVCFDCRKTFKKPPIEDLAIQNGDWEDYRRAFLPYEQGRAKRFRKENPERTAYLKERYRNRKEKCPECGEQMANMGLDFRAPKKDKVRDWRMIQGLYRTGRRFDACGCDGPGYIPKDERAYREHLLDMRACYAESLTQRDEYLSGENLADYLTYYQHKVELIDAELGAIR